MESSVWTGYMKISPGTAISDGGNNSEVWTVVVKYFGSKYIKIVNWFFEEQLMHLCVNINVEKSLHNN